MSLVLVGTSHKISPISLRERIAFSRTHLREILYFLLELEYVKGAVILSTCNRIEIYISTTDIEKAIFQIEGFISRYHEIPLYKLKPFLYAYSGSDALEHLFRVAGGLDSQVLGETQILGQTKEAYFQAKEIGSTDFLLNKVFLEAIEVGKKIRTQTKISEGNVSIGSAALNLVKKILGDLKGKRFLLIGAGKITKLLINYLKKEEVKAILVSNRTFEKAKALANQLNGIAIRFAQLKEHLRCVDVIISTTASPHIILKKEDLKETNRPLVIIDLALPRDVDPGVRDLEFVKLFDLEDISQVADENLEMRKKEAILAGEIIKYEVERLWESILQNTYS